MSETQLTVEAFKNQPRRFRRPIEDGVLHPNGSQLRYRYGCYFPATDLVVNDMGGRGTGEPDNVEWLDGELAGEKSPFEKPNTSARSGMGLPKQ